MKNIITLLAFIIAINSWAVAPYGIKGQAQSGTLYSNVHQFPNNQVTNTGGINALVETGNKNILINPSFEHLTFSTGWTNSAGTFTEETVIDIDGLKSAKLVLSSQTMSLTQSSTLYAAQFADGVQGLASVRVKSNVALKVCAIQAGTVSSSLCVNVQANNKWGLYKVPFILGATSNGISIASSGAVSGTVYIDDAFVGAVDLSATVDASRIAGESYFAGTASCTWSRTSTTIGAFTATAACPGPTINYSSMGQWQTTDSNLPRQTINNLPAGVYKAKFKVWEYAGAQNRLLNAFLFTIHLEIELSSYMQHLPVAPLTLQTIKQGHLLNSFLNTSEQVQPTPQPMLTLIGPRAVIQLQTSLDSERFRLLKLSVSVKALTC